MTDSRAQLALVRQFHTLWDVREQLLSPHEILIQAREMILCGLPYRRTRERQIVHSARLGKATRVKVIFTALDDDYPLPYGSDRAVFAWIQTKAYTSQDRFVGYDSILDFFDAFGLDRGGRNYTRFNERIQRLCGLGLRIRVDNLAADPPEQQAYNETPIKHSLTPRTTREARRRIADELGGQLEIFDSRYGFVLDYDFWQHLRTNPVPMPLPLMRCFHDEPKAWDFAQLALYRCYAARTSSVVPWEGESGLRQLLASTDQNPRRLRSTLNRVIRRIKVVYPQLPIELLPGNGGLRVAPWRPPNPAP